MWGGICSYMAAVYVTCASVYCTWFCGNSKAQAKGRSSTSTGIAKYDKQEAWFGGVSKMKLRNCRLEEVDRNTVIHLGIHWVMTKVGVVVLLTNKMQHVLTQWWCANERTTFIQLLDSVGQSRLYLSSQYMPQWLYAALKDSIEQGAYVVAIG